MSKIKREKLDTGRDGTDTISLVCREITTGRDGIGQYIFEARHFDGKGWNGKAGNILLREEMATFSGKIVSWRRKGQ